MNVVEVAKKEHVCREDQMEQRRDRARKPTLPAQDRQARMNGPHCSEIPRAHDQCTCPECTAKLDLAESARRARPDRGLSDRRVDVTPRPPMAMLTNRSNGDNEPWP
jgi:hypothetical protein